MEQSTETELTPVQDAPTNEAEVSNDQMRQMVHDFGNTIEKLASRVEVISSLLYNDNFKHVSKATRNDMLQKLLNEARDIEAQSRVVFRNLKKSAKRQRLQENEIDVLLGIPEDMISTGKSDETPEE